MIRTCLQIVFILIVLTGTLQGFAFENCPDGAQGLHPNGTHLCSGWNPSSCKMFPGEHCYAPLDAGVCCPSQTSGVTCPGGFTGRLVGGSHCSADSPCDVFPNHFCYIDKTAIVTKNSGVCCLI